MVSRRDLLCGMGAASSLLWLPPMRSQETGSLATVPATFPRTEPELASAMVGACHVDLEKVSNLLRENSSLANATWDWGFGDWETAIGAASHMGRRDIIETLIAHGASPTIFTFAALDQVDTVRAICQANSSIQKMLGPHGITLYKHAAMGKADRVMAYLQEIGDADVGQPEQPLTPEARAVYIGKYDFGGGSEDVLEVGVGANNTKLGIRRGGAGSFRFLTNQGEHRFSVFGSPQVDIRFEVSDNRAASLRLKDGRIEVSAKRIY